MLRAMRSGLRSLLVVSLLLGCSDDGGPAAPADAAPPRDAPPGDAPPADAGELRCSPFDVGGPGHDAPLGAGSGQARAGRVRAGDLPETASGLLTWAEGDWVLANDKVALVIEDVGHSDLYDPWGGRPVGMARVAGGRLVEPADFGEVFLLTGRTSIVTTHVGVVADGSDGGPAIVRAAGRLAPLPFFENITQALFPGAHLDVEAALDYVLAPGSDQVEVRFRYRAPRADRAEAILHGFMYTKRTPIFVPGKGFHDELGGAPWVALIDDAGTSWAYKVPGAPLIGGISASGFVGALSDGFDLAGACAETERLHTSLILGGPGLDGLVEAVARVEGRTLRAITGAVREASGAPAAGARVHAESDPDGKYLTRAPVDAMGRYTLHVPEGQAVRLTAYRRGDQVATAAVPAAGAGADLTFAPTGLVQVTATDAAGAPLPARIQLLPGSGSEVPSVPGTFAERGGSGGRLHVAHAIDGRASLRAPVGAWEVVVSRGYEYEIARQPVEVRAGSLVEVTLPLERVVATPGVQCADFHIHTVRSNDSDDDARLKVASAVADGLELPVRSEHEYADGFQDEIEAMGLERWAFGPGSIEMTSMEIWGHMGVFPLEEDRGRPNGGAPLWQEFPTAARPDVSLRTKTPKEVFDEVRARPEAPVIIVNHPRGNTNYFTYVGFDPATGMVELESEWDTRFTLVEVFNDASWTQAQHIVTDWMALNRAGRKVFAVGSSDSHGVSGSPVGYPRTCIELGTDDPRMLTAGGVRDALAAGSSTISGGLYLDVDVLGTRPGATLTGASMRVPVRIRVQGASWVDLDFVEVVVDGEVAERIEVMPSDADPANPVTRFTREVMVDVAPRGSFVVVAAHGDRTLEPVHPGRLPFAVSNPIYLQP